MTPTVLAIDDDRAVLALVRDSLEIDGFRVETWHEGAGADQRVAEVNPDLIIVDLHLPGLNGFGVCRRLREAGNTVPVLILSSRTEAVDKVAGLEAGADDFLSKPFHPRELAARVRALLRRVQEWSRPTHALATRRLRLEPASRRAYVNGQEVELTTLEFNILQALVTHSGEVLSRQRILDVAWGREFAGDERTVDAHMRNLRAKLRHLDPVEHIVSIRGVGYRLAD